MPSPFPGMNPYLERADVWHDFQKSLLVRLAEAIGKQLPENYIVQIVDHLYVHEHVAENHDNQRVADPFVAVFSNLVTSDSAVVKLPIQIVLPTIDVEHLSLIEIRDKCDRRLVTVIELLSPTNKYRGPDRDQYLVKRGGLLKSWTHLVEIDLLRGGPRMPFATPLPECDYCVMVSRKEQRPQADLWPITLREPLPKIPIPVREPDADAMLDLQAALHQVYDAARYRNYIYEGLPEPQLNAADAEWAAGILTAR